MGDCRIRLDIAKDLLPSEQRQQKTQPEGVKQDKNIITVTHTFSADTTIREVAEAVKELWDLLQQTTTSDKPSIWDCTIFPPKNISDWPLITYPDTTGPKSKTLHDSGCFPSGLWLVLPNGVHPNDFSRADYDDVQYNNKSSAGTNNHNSMGVNTFETCVLLKDSRNPNPGAGSREATSRPLPSQIFESVASRFTNDNQEEDGMEEERAKKQRRQNQENQKQILKIRAQKLDDRIHKLEEAEKGKNKTVSEQVRRMLVKSRATGDKSLKMQDRIYFQCIIDEGSDENDEESGGTKKDYRYFSPQDTAAKIALSFPSPKSGVVAQVLVRRPSPQQDGSDNRQVVYRRLPVAMRIYEAIAMEYLLDQVDTLVIRWTRDNEMLFPSVLEEEMPPPSPLQIGQGQGTDAMKIGKNEDLEKTANRQEHGEDYDLVQSEKLKHGCLVVDETLYEAIRAMDDASINGKKSKKSSAASSKVRHMQIKSKANGDKKRIPKMENRFFLEVVTVQGLGNKAESTFQFLAKTDTVERILQNVASGTPSDWDFLVPTTDVEAASYILIDSSLVLEMADSNGILKPFDRLILRSTTKAVVK